MVEEVKKEAAPETRRIVVAHAFVHTDDKGQRRQFEAGVHEDVPAELADHWYVKAHLSKDGKVPYGPGGGQANDDAEKRRLVARIEEQDATLRSAQESAERVAGEHAALKARAEGAEVGVNDAQSQIAALRKRVSELEADNAGLQVRAEKAERAAVPAATPADGDASKAAGRGGKGA